MRIIILGAGQVGESVAEALASEANDITIVDQSREAIGDIADRLDVRTLVGNGALPSVLKQCRHGRRRHAGGGYPVGFRPIWWPARSRAACSTSPRALPACARPTISTTRPCSTTSISPSPMRSARSRMITDYITRLIEFPEALQVLEFADGRVTLVCVRAYDGGLLVGKPIKTMREHLFGGCRCAHRGDVSASTSRSIPTATR
jgi:trk system potassium uptake protein TrkA